MGFLLIVLIIVIALLWTMVDISNKKDDIKSWEQFKKEFPDLSDAERLANFTTYKKIKK